MTTGDAAELCRPYDTGEAWGQREMSRLATMGIASSADVVSSPLLASGDGRAGRGLLKESTHVCEDRFLLHATRAVEQRATDRSEKTAQAKEVSAIRVRLEIAGTRRNLALFNLAIDSKLRACDLVVLRIEDVCLGGRMRDRATIIQRNRPTRPI